MDELVRAVGAALKSARSVAVLTGAGISAESGLRTFRGVAEEEQGEAPQQDASRAARSPGTMEGLWKSFDPMKLATPEAFAADPEMVTRWYDHRRLGCLAAAPNPGHLALAEIERRILERGESFTLLTQNVDRLHQRAGSRRVIELHGSIIEWRCVTTGTKVEPGPSAMTEFPPRSAAGGLLRPDVVWFGEMLPDAAVRAAHEAAEACDLFLSIGTSSQVYPAAGFIHLAKRNGAKTVEVNRDPTPISAMVDWAVMGKAGEVLPGVVEAMAM